jgi:hypothetical protein
MIFVALYIFTALALKLKVIGLAPEAHPTIKNYNVSVVVTCSLASSLHTYIVH